MAPNTLRPLARLFQPPKGYCRSVGTLNVAALDRWISDRKSLTLADTFTPTHLADLYVTLPTRDGTRGRPYQPLEEGEPLSYGHHLAFFHPRNPENALRPDGTDTEFCPPEPFTRRMWAGGTMQWNMNPAWALRVGEKARAVSRIASIEKKGFGSDDASASAHPMVFITQRIEVTAEGRSEPSVIEERSHVYLASGGGKRTLRQGTSTYYCTPILVVHAESSLNYSLPSDSPRPTEARFLVLLQTFIDHSVQVLCSDVQRSLYPPRQGLCTKQRRISWSVFCSQASVCIYHVFQTERLVHGPLTALMLLEALLFHRPGLQLQSFSYRARNPLIVNRTCTIYGSFSEEDQIDVWCEDIDGVVGMTGRVNFASQGAL